MHRQAAFYLSKFRILWAGIFAIAFLLIISALVTAIGKNSVLDSKTNPSMNTRSDISAGSDYISAEAANVVAGTRQDLMIAGRAIYTTCYSITKAANHSGEATIHGSTAAADDIGHGVVSVNHGVLSADLYMLHTVSRSFMFTYHMPGKIIGSVSRSGVRAMSTIVQPADTNPVPVIHTQLSSAELASIAERVQQDAENQQKLKEQQAAQAADNRRLDGVVVAGDPRHGGYPTTWDEAPEDSIVDSWGMLNRECVSYVAWKVYQTYGHMPFWGGEGNANEWPADARAAGIPTGSAPRAHSVAVSMLGYYGHAMWVEKVQGNMIYVSQYNYDLQGRYSEMWVDGSYFTYIYFG